MTSVLVLKTLNEGGWMVRTLSTMLELGTLAPSFALKDVVTGQSVTNDNFLRRPMLVMFICRHCPYVKHIEKALSRLGHDFRSGDLGIVAISSNDAETYTDDAPSSLKEMAVELGFTFPFCHDESQDVAKRYSAACTPDFFLFDSSHRLVYRGQFDDSRPGNQISVTGADLRKAIDDLLAGKQVTPEQRPSVGCNIKWKPGNEPAYFGA